MYPEIRKPNVALVRFFNMTTDEQAVLRKAAPDDFRMLVNLANAACGEIRQEFFACLHAMDAKSGNDKSA